MNVRTILSSTALLFTATLAPAAELPDGKALYGTYCVGCHASGAAGAPKVGDAAAWEKRTKKGIQTLYASALKGTGTMPARGGAGSLSDAQVMAIVNYMVGASHTSGSAAQTAPAEARAPAKAAPVEARVAPARTPDTGAGKTVYQMSCAACHTSGVAGAPKLGDTSAWASRVAQGMPALYARAIKGTGAMPPKGGNAGLPDTEVRAAVDFIVSQVRPAAAAAERTIVAAAAPAARSSDAPAAEQPRVTVARALEAPAAAAPAVAARAPSGAGDPNAFNRLWSGSAQRNPPPLEDGIHDPASAGTSALQPPAASFDKLPRATAGNYVNWVGALSARQIQPRWEVKAPGEPTVMDMNIVREVKGTMPDVVFPHKQHTEWLDCASCHPAIFVPQKGANRMSMASIVMGQGCGTCHGKVAFPISDCRLCHSRSKDAARTASGR